MELGNWTDRKLSRRIGSAGPGVHGTSPTGEGSPARPACLIVHRYCRVHIRNAPLRVILNQENRTDSRLQHKITNIGRCGSDLHQTLLCNEVRLARGYAHVDPERVPPDLEAAIRPTAHESQIRRPGITSRSAKRIDGWPNGYQRAIDGVTAGIYRASGHLNDVPEAGVD